MQALQNTKLALDTAPLVAGLAAADQATQQLTQSSAALTDAQAAVATAQAATADATAATVEATAAAGDASAAAASAEQAQTAAVDATTQSLQEQIATLQEQVAAQQEQIAGLQESSARLKEHAGAANEGAAAIHELGLGTRELATEALPGLSQQFMVATSLFRAGKEGLAAVNEEEKSFAETTAILGGGLAAAGVGAGAAFFGVFDSGLTTLHNTAVQFGLTIPQVEGLQTALMSVGLPAGSATMALRMMSSRAQELQQQLDEGKTPSGNFTKALDTIGLSAVDSSGHVMQMGTLLPQVFAKFAETSEHAKETGENFNAAGLASELFGQRAGPQLVPLLSEGAEGWQKFTDMATKGGIGSEEQVAHLEALHSATATTSLELKSMAMAIGSDVAPAVTAGITLVGDFTQEIGKMPGPIRDLTVTAPLAAGGLLLTASAGAKLVSSVKDMIPALVTRTAATDAAAVADVSEATAAEAVTAAMAAQVAAEEAVASGEALIATGGIAAAAATEGLAAAEETAAVASTTLALTPLGAAMLALTGIIAAVTVGIGLYTSGQKDAKEAEDKTIADMKQQTGEVTAEVSKLQAAGLSQAQISDIAAEKIKELTPAYDAATAAISAYADKNNIAASDVANHLDKVEKLHPEFKTLYDTVVQLGGSYYGWSAALKTSTDDVEAQTNAAEISRKHLESLRAQIGITSDGTLEFNQAMDAVDAATKKAGTSASEATAFQTALARSTDDAKLSEADWAKQKEALTQLQQNGTDADKLEAAAEITLAEATRVLGPTIRDAAVAQEQLTAATAKLQPVLQQIASEVRSAGTESQKFNQDLAVSASVASSAWAAQYGAAAQAIAGSMHTASVSAVHDWQTANEAVLLDEQALAAAIKSNADDTEQTRIKDKLAADQQIQQSAADTANAQISDENAYVASVESISKSLLADRAKIFDDELKLSHLTTEEKATDLAKWLQAEIITTQAIEKLEQDLANTTDKISRAIITAQIAIAKAGLDQIAENAREATATAAANTKIDTASASAATDAIKSETQAENDLSSARKAGLEIVKQQRELTKTAGEDTTVYTAAQVSALHGVTEGYRAQAQAALGATAVAQQQWEAVVGGYDAGTKASKAYTQAEIDNAKAAYTAAKGYSDEYLADFQDALQQESTASKALDAQKAASAEAERTYASDRRSFAKDESNAFKQLMLDAATSSHGITSSMGVAATQAFQAWKAADAQVLADQKVLTGTLSVEDRKQAEDKLKADQAIQDDAKGTAQDVLAAWTATAAAQKQLDADSYASSKQLSDLRVQDVTGAASADITAYQQANARVLSDERALTQNLSDDDRARVEADLASDIQIRDNRLHTAQDSVKAENDYVSSYNSAVSKIISLEGEAFDAADKYAHMTASERQSGLGQWLQAEIATVNAIMALEAQLANATDEITRKSIQYKIDQLNHYLEFVKLMEHEAETAAQHLDQAAQQATSSIGQNLQALTAISGASLGAMDTGFQGLTSTISDTSTAVNTLSDQVSQLEGVFAAPSTEELKLQQQLDQTTIQLDKLKEAGTAATDPMIVALLAQQKALQDQISPLADERKATEDLAKTQGTLAAGVSNSMDTIRSLTPTLVSLEEQTAKTTLVQHSFYDTAQQATTWGDTVTGAIGKVITAYAALQQATGSASGGGGGGGAVSGGGVTGAGAGTGGLTSAPGDGTQVGQANGINYIASAMLPSSGTRLPNGLDAFQSPGVIAAINAVAQGAFNAWLASQGSTKGITFGGGSGVLPHYGRGTSGVPEDQLAFVDRGEIIVPPELTNSRQGPPFAGGASGPQTMTFHFDFSNAQFTGTPQENERMMRKVAREEIGDQLGRRAYLNGLRTRG